MSHRLQGGRDRICAAMCLCRPARAYTGPASKRPTLRGTWQNLCSVLRRRRHGWFGRGLSCARCHAVCCVLTVSMPRLLLAHPPVSRYLVSANLVSRWIEAQLSNSKVQQAGVPLFPLPPSASALVSSDAL